MSDPLYENLPPLRPLTAMAAPMTHHEDPIYQSPRLRGVSADRFREYRTPQFYDDTYYRYYEDSLNKYIGLGVSIVETNRDRDGEKIESLDKSQ
jgi:hypothetical protein